MKLKEILAARGYTYPSTFTDRAIDIEFDSIEEVCFSLGYILRNVSTIDAEIPEELAEYLVEIMPNYPITSGYTSGGNEMKWGRQYRIYFSSLRNIPEKLYERIQNDSKMRMTGSKFIESCLFLGFAPGNAQNEDLVFEVIREIFNENEQRAFFEGYNS